MRMVRARRIALAMALAGLSGGCLNFISRSSVNTRPIAAARRAHDVSESLGTVRGEVVAPPMSVAPAAFLNISPRLERALNPRLPLRLSPGRRNQLHMDILIGQRKLVLVDGRDTILTTPVAVASGLTLHYAGRAWTFKTPKGERHVLRKAVDPVWTPPDWHYAETAADYHLRLVRIPAGGAKLSRGRRLVVREGRVGVIEPNEDFRPLRPDEHIVFDGQLFIPPYGTDNRRVTGELGPYALDLGDGYMIHGSIDESAFGQARTHGCIRVNDDDLRWLFENVPIGTKVRIY
jgi:lipoprotein-anchoring transpeptidase ErfK/SrfK